jgi:hypothetical protein
MAWHGIRAESQHKEIVIMVVLNSEKPQRDKSQLRRRRRRNYIEWYFTK